MPSPLEPAAAPEKVVTAAVLVIGNEILSGRTKDANLGFLAQELTRIGIQLREARVIADAEAEIVVAVNECRARYDYAKNWTDEARRKWTDRRLVAGGCDHS